MTLVELDNRGLEPPEPMVRILTALAQGGVDTELKALMDREPVLLYPELERRGYSWDLSAEDDHFVLLIKPASA